MRGESDLHGDSEVQGQGWRWYMTQSGLPRSGLGWHTALQSSLVGEDEGRRSGTRQVATLQRLYEQGPVLPKGFFGGEGQASCHEHQIHVIVSGTAEGDFWRQVAIFRSIPRKFGDGSRSGIWLARVLLCGLELARLVLLEGTVQTGGGVEMARCGSLCSIVITVSRNEIQQDSTMAVVDPEQAAELADSSDGGAEVLFVDS
ncbi:hypothetical protein NDU88_001125 [Pleurodeles waltl]|uniref:Uncharacterized protein n=1 Tax=Pleurodeles waltl TaxID=8319 RepID=A0AAV7SYC8_PLEWA|nr:hypothetical protein NDU88_001125 [Pleurodeles waltl]